MRLWLSLLLLPVARPRCAAPRRRSVRSFGRPALTCSLCLAWPLVGFLFEGEKMNLFIRKLFFLGVCLAACLPACSQRKEFMAHKKKRKLVAAAEKANRAAPGGEGEEPADRRRGGGRRRKRAAGRAGEITRGWVAGHEITRMAFMCLPSSYYGRLRRRRRFFPLLVDIDVILRFLARCAGSDFHQRPKTSVLAPSSPPPPSSSPALPSEG